MRDPEYLGLGAAPYPAVIETLDALVNGDAPEGVLVWGIGAGKTYLARLFLAHTAARVLIEMDRGVFWQRFHLDHGTPVRLSCYAPTHASASDVLFRGLMPMLEESPWFQQYYPVDTKVRSRVCFRKPGRSTRRWPLDIVPFGAAISGRIGLNILAAVVDETEFFVTSAGKKGDEAEELLQDITRRIRSRFGQHGKVLLISSAGRHDGLCQRKLDEAREHPERVFGSCRSTWDVKPLTAFPTPESVDLEVDDPEGDGTIELKGVPVDLAPDFAANPRRSLRDYACVATAALEPYDPGAQRLFAEPPYPVGRGPWKLPPAYIGPYRVPEWVTPENCEQLGVYDCDWGARSAAAYFIHVDLGLTNDAAGLALSHVVWMDRETVRHMKLKVLERTLGVVASVQVSDAIHADEQDENPFGVVVDWTHRVDPRALREAGVGEQVDIAAVRGVVLELQRRGFPIVGVSYDGFQSAESVQALRKHQLRTELVSVDRDAGPYERLRELLHGGRLIYGESEWLDEYAALELVRGAKIDHGAGGSKDVADGVAGSVSQAELWARRREWGDVREASASDDEEALLEKYGEEIDVRERELLERYGDGVQ